MVLATCLFKERELSSVTPSKRTESTNGITTTAIVKGGMVEALVRSLALVPNTITSVLLDNIDNIIYYNVIYDRLIVDFLVIKK